MLQHLEVLMFAFSQAKPIWGDVNSAKQRRLEVRRSSGLPLYNPAAMSTLMRTLRNLRRIGFKVSNFSSFPINSRHQLTSHRRNMATRWRYVTTHASLRRTSH